MITLRDNLRKLYAEYGEYMRPVFRFLLAFFFLVVFKNTMCYNETFAKPLVLLGLSLLCAFMNTGCVSFVVFIYCLANMYSVSYAAFLFASVFFLLVLMLYFGMRPGKGLILSLVPVGFLLHVPYLCPVILGLLAGASSIIPCTLGVLSWFMIRYFSENAETLSRTSNIEQIAKEFLSFLENFLSNKELYVVIAAFVACILITWLLSRLSMDHAWTIAVLTGVLFLGVVIFAGNSWLGIETDVAEAVIGILTAILGGLLYEFLFFRLDYKASEHLQFEDDEYYYYVKAVPKAGDSTVSDRRE